MNFSILFNFLMTCHEDELLSKQFCQPFHILSAELWISGCMSDLLVVQMTGTFSMQAAWQPAAALHLQSAPFSSSRLMK